MTVASPGQSTSTQAIASLVLAILAFICCPILAPIAWYLGNQELKAIAAGTSPASGEGIAKAGKILGIIGTLYMVFVLLWIFFWGGMVFLQGIMNR
jgi:hypothetical protein